jgi:hypothetical protein
MNYPNPDEGQSTWTMLVRMSGEFPVEITNEPLVRWKTDLGKAPSNEYLVSQGYYGYIIDDTITSEFLESNNFNPQLHKIVICDLNDCVIDHENKTVTAFKKVVDISARDFIQNKEEKIQQILNLVAENLENSEWVQNSDNSEEFKSKWQNYRTQLSLITAESIGDPYTFELPEPPGMTLEDGEKSTKNVLEYFIQHNRFPEE